MKLELKYIYIIPVLFLCQFLIVQSVNGQVKVPEKCLYHFNDLQRKQTWTNSYNAAGLHFIDFDNSSYIETYVNKNDGPFVKYYESDNSINFGLKTASYTKIKKTVYYGKIDYNNFVGQNMTWSGLINPERYMLLLANDIPAEKAKESYKISGGFSTPLTKNLLLGVKLNYEVGNLTKRKDLRHETRLLDIEVCGGLIYKTDWLNVGANYYYQKFHENIKFSKIAKDEINYNGYLFKGLWFGIMDTWSQDVLNLSRPFVDKQNGGSLQFEFLLNNYMRFFNEFTYKNQKGITGPGADKEYSQSEAVSYEYKGIFQFEKETTRHYLRLNTNYTDANNYDKITNNEYIGGIYIVRYYGLNKTFSKWKFNFNPEYEVAFGKYKSNPDWNIKIGYNYSSQSSISSLVYPFYFTQDIIVNSEYLKINKNLFWHKGMIDLSLLGSYSKGCGEKLKQHKGTLTTTEQISEDIIPYQQVDMLNREYEFLTTGKFHGEAGIRYSCFLTSKKLTGAIYIDGKYRFTTTSELAYHQGSHAGMFSLALGFSF